jgi:hypothetical protein
VASIFHNANTTEIRINIYKIRVWAVTAIGCGEYCYIMPTKQKLELIYTRSGYGPNITNRLLSDSASKASNFKLVRTELVREREIGGI